MFFFRLFACLGPAALGSIASAADLPGYLTSRAKILEAARPAEFRAGPGFGKKPAPSMIIGAAHVAGRYHLTDKPFLVEGAGTLDALGYPGLKLWLTSPRTAYPYHSDWKDLGPDPSLLEMIRPPYYREALRLPFKVIALEVQDVRAGEKPAGHSIDPDSDFTADESQVHELTKHLLAEFKDREVTFILQNWEGDWMFRGGARVEWEKGGYPELERRTDAFVRWFSARQRGVDRAEAEMPASKAKVLHAIEVNKVLDTWKGIPTLTSEVLPKVRVDLISWSCYDGLQSWKKSAEVSAVGIWQGIETIRHFAAKGPDGSPIPVMLGEIGVPEQKDGFAEKSVAAVFDGALSASACMNVPYVFLWEL